jgi:hypothetical protein
MDFWISDICERLMHDGVDVVADLYELPHSADIHAFMERCVRQGSTGRPTSSGMHRSSAS